MRKANFVFAAVFAAIVSGAFAPQAAGAQSFYTGDGGKAIRLAVLEPEGKSLGGDDWMPAYIQGILNANFGKYSAITVVDRQNMDKILAEQQLSETGYYAETDYAKIGNVTNANHILAGQILKISATQYSLQLAVSHAETGVRKASFTVNTTPEKLRDAAALNQATADLLGQLGVNLTEAAKTALGSAQSEQAVNAQANLAKGIEAMKKGTVVEALSYFIQSANIDPSLAEAASRVNITSSNITSGNIGADARNAIAWRKAWVARLSECDQFVTDYVKNNPLPTTLVYSTDLEQGEIDWDKETLPISFDIGLSPDQNWSAPITGVVDAVYAGLAGTGQAETWKLDWPARNASGGASQVTPEVTVKYNVAVQLLNDQGQVLGSQTIALSAGWKTGFSNGKASAAISQTTTTVKFPAVDANRITDKLTIIVVSLDGQSAETAARTKKVSILTIAEYQKARFGREYKTGDRGPAGGIMLVNGIVFLEVAPANTEFRASWNEAMSKCSTLQIGGTSGWRLPTKDELNTMYLELKRKGLGGFSTSRYWSSSEYSYYAWYQLFADGSQDYLSKNYTYSVRAVRAF
jgi:polyisoprenoid-binding protein YceI